MEPSAWIVMNSSADLENVRSRFEGSKIVYCSGSFDLTHPGHILFFEDCKKHGNVLVVSVGCDKNIRSDKGKARPVMSEKMRLKFVSSLRAVDVCFLDAYVPKTEECPLYFLNIIFRYLRPDVYVVNSDASAIEFRRELAQNFNVQFVVLERFCPPEFDGISTTKLIQRIKSLPN